MAEDERSTDPSTRSAIAQSAAEVLELRGELEHMRSGANELFRIGDVVLRVGTPEIDVAAQLDLIAYLAEAGIPVLGPQRDVLVLDGVPVTVWDYIEPGQPVEYEQLGQAVARLHALDPSPVVELISTPPCHEAMWLDLRNNLEIAARSAVVTVDDIDILRRAVDELDGWQDQARKTRQVVCHGDLHPENVLMRDDSLVILDWDSICTGPPAWDHAPLLTWSERWGGDPATYATFADGYGVDLTDDSLARILAEVRLLAPTINMIIRGAASHRHATEAQTRMRYWRGEPDAPHWTPQ
jgi:Ser/Thr protein kinase RdoA (MazF antagonist)